MSVTVVDEPLATADAEADFWKPVAIIGPLTNGGTLPPEVQMANYQRLLDAAEDIRSWGGYIPLLPVVLSGETPRVICSPQQWKSYILRALACLLDADIFFCVSGWQDSKGARLMRHCALTLGLQEISPPFVEESE